MTELLEHQASSHAQRQHVGKEGAAGPAATPAGLGDIHTLTDAVIDRMRGDDSQRFLERVRQSRGE